MSFREVTRNMSLYLGLLAFVIVAGLSYERGVELLISVLRGAGAFLAIFIFQRVACQIFDAWSAWDETEAAEPVSIEADTYSKSDSRGRD
ncbi:MAG: hypothetical protein GTO55_08795 [Armatimonadetes bacterium]|nr:hypothetical protein [Armatimonadota bacterium]NIM24344.1 hypothetical protein [Armatimonadota bacterium]NIM68213.1 hypothetical protein [Armatimonadota bacterium]NIM75114.1 hypothetical protein [Armatimonadota bacterium]NIN06418.1 hypothetical protein [Armatimonadota bacterium]